MHTRKNVFVSGCDVRSFTASGGFVSVGLVAAGLICASPASFEIGIWAFATLELKGPTIASTASSATKVFTFCAPWAGSCAPCTASSRSYATNLKPPGTPLALASSTASTAPLRVGMPWAASPPLSGRSIPILIVAPPGASDDVDCELVDVVDDDEHAVENATAVRTASRANPPVRTISTSGAGFVRRAKWLPFRQAQ